MLFGRIFFVGVSFILVVLFLVVAAVAVAQTVPEGEERLTSLLGARVAKDEARQFREDTFKGLDRSVRALAALAKDYSQSEAEELVGEVARLASRIPHGFHPDGRDFSRSEAKPEIWQNEAEFIARAGALEAAARLTLEAGITETDLPRIIGELGGACQACHRQFRARR
ncbi:MAG: cytochrome c [Alphaproteobacteria bacterium]